MPVALFRLALVGMLALALTGPVEAQRVTPQSRSAPPAAAKARVQAALGTLPLYFIENQGQVDARVAYYIQGRDTTVYFTPQGLTIALTGPAGPAPASHADGHPAVAHPSGLRTAGPEGARKRWAVKLHFVGANPAARPRGQDPTPTVVSYFKGPREQWTIGQRTYASLVYPDLWPGIDLVFTGTAASLKYTFLLHPGADPEQIKLAYRGARRVTLTGAGELDVSTPVGDFRDATPYAYQEVGGRRLEVAATYALGQAPGGAHHYGFRLGPYDRGQPLVLDPTILVYAGYLGGAGFDAGFGVAVDGAGHAYVTGTTTSSEASFPVTDGPDPSYNGANDVFVAKVNAAGTGLAYVSYLGGNGHDVANGIAVDGGGNAYITGLTASSEASFPVIGGPDLTFNGGAFDAFVAKVDGQGTGLVYAGYLGGSGHDVASGIAVDSAGHAYVAGETDSSGAPFPVTVGPDTSFNGGPLDAFVAKVNALGTGLDYAGYLGGSGTDVAFGVAVDGAGHAYVTGVTASSQTSFPVTVGPDMSFNGGTFDAFVAKVNGQGTGLDYAGYLGGAGLDRGFAIAVDGLGHAYVTGDTASPETSFPVAVGPDLSFNGGPFDGFVAKVNAPGTGLDYAGYLGGAGDEGGLGIAVDGAGHAYVTGLTDSSETTFPVTDGPDLTFNGGAWDAFVVKLHPSGTGFDYAGYIGGAGEDRGWAIAVDSAGHAYVAGDTQSAETTFPETGGPDVTFNGGPRDAFVAKIADLGLPAMVSLTPASATNPVDTQHCVTATVQDAGGHPLSNVTVHFFVAGSINTSGSAPTDANGQATFCYTGPRAPGSDVITAYADTNQDGTQDDEEPSGQATNTWIAGPPATLTLTPPTATNPVGARHCVTATVADASGNPTPGIPVRFAVTGAVTTSGAVTTDAQGQGAFCYTGPRAPGSDVITAYADTDQDGAPDGGEPSGGAAKSWIAGPPATLTLTPPTATDPVGTQHCVTATVSDAFGNPTPGVPVRFAVTGAVTTSGSATTHAQGQGAFCYTGPRAPGSDVITAYADTDQDSAPDGGEPSGGAAKTWIAGPPATLTLTPPTAIDPVGTQHCVTATVSDAFGNPTPGVPVRFAVTGAVTTSGSATTHAQGQGAFCYTGPRAPGSDVITAYADTDQDGTADGGEPSGGAAKTWIVGPPATLTLTPPTAIDPVGTQHCVTATVSDAFGNPTPGVPVRFAVTGAVTTSGSATTHAQGQGAFCYTGPRAPGSDVITAYADTDQDGTADGGEPSGGAAKTWIVGPPATLTLTPPGATDPVETQHCVTATVTDAFGNPTPGVPVRFAVTGAVTTSGSATTDAQGQGGFCYTGPALPGADTITAYADRDDDGTQDVGEPNGRAEKTWVLPASTPLCAITEGGQIPAANGDRATFSGNVRSSKTGTIEGQQHYRDHGPAQPLSVRSIKVLASVCEGPTQASIYGEATIDGVGSFLYRIDVKDLAGPGNGIDTYRIRLGNGYDSGEQMLNGGNVQIRP